MTTPMGVSATGVRGLAALATSVLLLVGCSPLQTTTSVQTTPQPEKQWIRLTRHDTWPLTAVWRQEERTLVGKVAFTPACQTATVRETQRLQVRSTHANRTYVAASYVIGGLLSAAAIGAFAASGDASEQVHCGSGGAPKDGDQCTSTAGALRTAGVVSLGIGLSTIIGGVIVHHLKPQTDVKSLPPERRVELAPAEHACGRVPALEGIVVAATLSDGGTWSGQVDGEGNVRIELGASLALGEHQTAKFAVASSTPASAFFATAGLPLGELALRRTRGARRYAQR